MKKKIKYVLVILMFLCIFLTGCSKLSVVQEYVYNDSNYEIGNKAFNDEIETIEIDWIVGNINIIQSTNHELIIREEIDLEIDDKYKMHYKLDENKLDIKFSASTNFLNYNFKTKNLYVFLPTVINKVKINNVSADIKINYVNIQNLEIENISGDIEVYNCKISDLEINNISGEMIIFDDEVEIIDIESISGNIGLNLIKLPQKLDIETTSASLTLYINEYDEFSIEFKSISGTLKSNLKYNIEGRVYIFNNGTLKYQVETISGKTKVIGK